MIPRSVSPVLLALTALLTSCGKPAVESYRVPKEVAATAPATPGMAPAASPAPQGPAGAPPAAAGGSMANTAVATASGAGLTWTAPAHWKTKTGSAMRKGSYAITAEGVTGEADLSITAFPGDVGGDLANLNRWREQIQLPPVSQAEMEAARQRMERNGLKMTLVDIASTGADAKRILGAMIPYEGATWFVKLMGPDGVVAKERPAFMAFLDTVKPAAAAR